jgi:hypothetical protein
MLLVLKKYAGTYDKNYWQGYTLQVGTGIDFKISIRFWQQSAQTVLW